MLTRILTSLGRLRSDEEGATLVEYGIALGLAITLGAGALSVLANDVGATMNAASAALPATAPTTP